jgi:hypothetical protein
MQIRARGQLSWDRAVILTYYECRGFAGLQYVTSSQEQMDPAKNKSKAPARTSHLVSAWMSNRTSHNDQPAP